MHKVTRSVALLGVATLCQMVIAQSPAPVLSGGDNFIRLSRMTAVKSLSNGIEVHAGVAAMRVEALRENVIRVRLTPDGKWQEDASWAVVPGRVKESAQAKPFNDSQWVGFDTKLLKVRVERASTRLVVQDLAGNIISEDAPGRPAQFTGPRDLQGGEFRLWKSLRADEHFFGLGDKTGPLDHRNQSFNNWNTDAFLFQESTDPLYKTIPFFLAESWGRYYGMFLDNTWRTSFDFGKDLRDAYSFGADGGPLDYYVLYGPDPKTVVKTYAWLTGLPPLPPLWSLGFQQSRYSYAPQSQLREVADRLRKDKIPADVLWLDIDYQDRNRPFTTDPVGYANFPQLISDMKAMQFHVVAITDLHVADAPNQGYAPYDSGLKGDRFVKNPDGSNYVGESWPGKVVFPDFTQQSTREWWGTNFEALVKAGVDGFWNDMNEPSIRNEPTKTMPLTTVHRIDGTGFAPRLASHREVHNVFGSQNARATYEGALKLRPNERPYVMTRAAYSGGQRYSVTWTGDNTSTWNHLRMTTSMITNLGLSGYAFSGADVGAHVGSPQPDLLTKWMEISAFQPIDRNHSAKNSNPQEVWVNGPEAEAVARKFVEVRYRLLPYSYTLAEETSRTGLPMLRPLFLEFPDVMGDKHPVDLDAKGEFMWGADLLIAPPAFFETANKYSPILPGNTWYDFWTGAKIVTGRPLNVVAAETTEYNSTTSLRPTAEAEAQLRRPAQGVPGIKITATINELPVYVRGGAIIPMQAVVQSTAETPKGPLELRVYPGQDCRGSMYLDDGHTFNYQHGEYLRTEYRCKISPDGIEVTIGKRDGRYTPWWSQVEVVVFGIPSARTQATLASGTVLATTFDETTHTLHAIVPESAAGMVVRFSN